IALTNACSFCGLDWLRSSERSSAVRPRSRSRARAIGSAARRALAHGMAAAQSLRERLVAHVHDLDLLLAARAAEGHHVADPGLEQRARDRSNPAHPVAQRIDFVHPDNGDG